MFIEFPPVSMEEWEAAARLDGKGKDPGKILYGVQDLPDFHSAQPWPLRPWQIWAEVSDSAGARRALTRGAEGLVVADPRVEWLKDFEGVHVHTTVEEALSHGLTIVQQLACRTGGLFGSGKGQARHVAQPHVSTALAEREPQHPTLAATLAHLQCQTRNAPDEIHAGLFDLRHRQGTQFLRPRHLTHLLPIGLPET